VGRNRKLLLFLAVPLLAVSLVLIHRNYTTPQVGRFIPVPDEDMRSYGVVFDTTTGKNCSIYSFSKDVQELRQTFLNQKYGKPVGHDEGIRYDVFKEHLAADEKAYSAQAYYVTFGKCPR
jgi:hypothetical protein